MEFVITNKQTCCLNKYTNFISSINTRLNGVLKVGATLANLFFINIIYVIQFKRQRNIYIIVYSTAKIEIFVIISCVVWLCVVGGRRWFICGLFASYKVGWMARYIRHCMLQKAEIWSWIPRERTKPLWTNKNDSVQNDPTLLRSWNYS